MFPNLLRRVLRSPFRTRRPQGPGRRRLALALESLEGRTVPSFLPAVNYAVGSLPEFVTIGDFNADGVLDFATVNYVGPPPNLSVRWGLGDGTFTGNTSLPAGQIPEGIATADMNSDGCDDLVSTSGSENNFSIAL